jgi:hypothetical protein
MRQAFIDNQMTLKAEAAQSWDGEMETTPSETRDISEGIVSAPAIGSVDKQDIWETQLGKARNG